MAGCPALRTRPVALHVHAHLTHLAHLAHRPSHKAHSWQDTQRVHTRGVASRNWEVVTWRPSLSCALMHARSICWYNTDVSRIALRYVSLAFRIAP